MAKESSPYSLPLSRTAVTTAASGFSSLLAAFSVAVHPALAQSAADADAAAAAAALADACAQELGGTSLNTVILVACVLQFIALTGAGVGGWIARLRKQEVERINAQLRQININLRKQARVESYAPSLSYAPVGIPAAAAAAAATAAATILPPAGAASSAAAADAAEAASMPSSKLEILRLLKEGKRCLREGDNARAFVEFEKGLALARKTGDALEEKKAERGCGASLQRQGKYKEAITFHQMVLAKSASTGEHAGDTEAYGAIADCYTELGDLEAAAKYYDTYISRMEEDDE